jgi:hypothetical protein
MAMAEALAKTKLKNVKMGSKDAIDSFFSEIITEDESLLCSKFRRSVASASGSQFRFKSIINILYQVRNDTVHGTKFWEFHLADEKDVEEGMTLMTWGYLGPRGRKRKEIVELTLTFQDLVDIFVRTGLENIHSVLKK